MIKLTKNATRANQATVVETGITPEKARVEIIGITIMLAKILMYHE